MPGVPGGLGQRDERMDQTQTDAAEGEQDPYGKPPSDWPAPGAGTVAAPGWCGTSGVIARRAGADSRGSVPPPAGGHQAQPAQLPAQYVRAAPRARRAAAGQRGMPGTMAPDLPSLRRGGARAACLQRRVHAAGRGAAPVAAPTRPNGLRPGRGRDRGAPDAPGGGARSEPLPHAGRRRPRGNCACSPTGCTATRMRRRAP
jgi:hypothetical protein